MDVLGWKKSYTYPMTWITYHLVINQEIDIPHLYHHICCPIQCRVNGVIINDTPRSLTNEPTPQTNNIVINIKDSGAENDNLILLLSLKGMTLYLPVHYPTK